LSALAGWLRSWGRNAADWVESSREGPAGPQTQTQPLAPASLSQASPEPHVPNQLGPLRDEIFLTAFLHYAMAQAKRNQESISVLCVSIDRFPAIRTLLGSELAEAAVQRVAETIVKVLRASDIVARIGDCRIIAALAFARKSDALIVAETVRQAVARIGSPSLGLPVLTPSIGVATYPEDGADPAALITAATAAMNHNGNQDQEAGVPGAKGSDQANGHRAGRRES
jgi:diguanylate cyclase (GGDEF)-like protein